MQTNEVPNKNLKPNCNVVRNPIVFWVLPCTQMFLFVFSLMILFEFTISLKLEDLQVPSHVPLGTRAALSCRWQLGPADVLYSVKWYKDGKEFFRHVPRDVEPRRKFPLPGVDVQEFNSSVSHIVLMPATLETGGRYRCEVSGEGPLFPTVSEHADMTVVILPEHGPSVAGLKSRYRPGDRVTVNCTSGQSRPATLLAWYINGEPQPDITPSYCSENGLVTTNLVLDFVIDAMHFENDLIKVKCLATMIPVYWRSQEQATFLDRSKAHEHLDKRNTIAIRAHTRRVQDNSSILEKPIVLLVLFVICVLIL